MKKIKCRICHQEKKEDFHKSCRFCGMPLVDRSREFCSRYCRIAFFRDAKLNKPSYSF